jgi:hypothetical protein
VYGEGERGGGLNLCVNLVGGCVDGEIMQSQMEKKKNVMISFCKSLGNVRNVYRIYVHNNLATVNR